LHEAALAVVSDSPNSTGSSKFAKEMVKSTGKNSVRILGPLPNRPCREKSRLLMFRQYNTIVDLHDNVQMPVTIET